MGLAADDGSETESAKGVHRSAQRRPSEHGEGRKEVGESAAVNGARRAGPVRSRAHRRRRRPPRGAPSPSTGSPRRVRVARGRVPPRWERRRYQVDPACSLMLVLRVKPCTPMLTLHRRGSRELLSISAIIHGVGDVCPDTCRNPRANTCTRVLLLTGLPPRGEGAFIRILTGGGRLTPPARLRRTLGM